MRQVCSVKRWSPENREYPVWVTADSRAFIVIGCNGHKLAGKSRPEAVNHRTSPSDSTRPKPTATTPKIRHSTSESPAGCNQRTSGATAGKLHLELGKYVLNQSLHMRGGLVLTNYERIGMSASVSQLKADLKLVLDVLAEYTNRRKNLQEVKLLHSR